MPKYIITAYFITLFNQRIASSLGYWSGFAFGEGQCHYSLHDAIAGAYRDCTGSPTPPGWHIDTCHCQDSLKSMEEILGNWQLLRAPQVHRMSSAWCECLWPNNRKPVVQHDWFGLRSVMAWGGISTDLYRLSKLAYMSVFAGIRMKSLEPLSDPTLVQWVLGSSGWMTMPGLMCQEH